MHIYSKSVHTNACNKQSDVCYLSYFHVHTAINILRCFGYSREQNFGLVLILNPTGCTEGCVYFPQSCRNTHLPHFLDCLLNTTLIPCLLVFFLSILHERVCDYSRVQSSVTGILRMGDMNIHITWLTHVRTGPKKKNRVWDALCSQHFEYGSNYGHVFSVSRPLARIMRFFCVTPTDSHARYSAPEQESQLLKIFIESFLSSKRV